MVTETTQLVQFDRARVALAEAHSIDEVKLIRDQAEAKTEPCTTEKPDSTGKLTFIETVGYYARAVAMKDGKEISAAEAVCFKDEPNWKTKPLFQLLSMAQTRACAKAMRNCLAWVVKLPLDSDRPKQEFAEESVEEAQASFNS